MTSSTVSRLSAPRSSTNDASGVTRSSSTPSWSTMIFFTRSETGSMTLLLCLMACVRPKLPILHVEAAVHPQNLSGDVSGRFRYQKRHRRRNVLGLAHPSERDRAHDGFLGLVGHRVRHVGLDEPGGDR